MPKYQYDLLKLISVILIVAFIVKGQIVIPVIHTLFQNAGVTPELMVDTACLMITRPFTQSGGEGEGSCERISAVCLANFASQGNAKAFSSALPV